MEIFYYMELKNKCEECQKKICCSNKLIFSILDSFTILIPCFLPIINIFSKLFYTYNLSKKNIKCISEDRLNISGLINTIIIDKTGTLTEKGLELEGFQIAKSSMNRENRLPVKFFETIPKINNSIHLEFWKRYCLNPNDNFFNDYQNNYENNYVYFIECLATCHNLELNNDDTLGNSLDMKLYESLDWKIKKEEIIKENEVFIYL